MSAFYVVRPAGLWLGPETPRNRRRSPWTFKASWTDTIDLLERELRHLKARDVVLQVDVQEKDIRIDGMLRANATPGHPGVRISFESVHGPLTYATDSCAYWQHNVRSIALGLEALRAVDRYGVTQRGEQYAGWKALPSGTGDTASHMTEEDAIAVLADLMEIPVEHFNTAPESLRHCWRRARRLTHPDRNDGDQTRWDQVEQAATVLGLNR